ncbi:hypothetical protein ACLOJK_022032 [Asimina triloba]
MIVFKVGYDKSKQIKIIYRKERRDHLSLVLGHRFSDLADYQLVLIRQQKRRARMDREWMVGKEVKGEIRSQKEEEAEISEDVAVLEIVNSIQKRRPASAAGRRLLQGGEQPPTIYRVPKLLRQANEKCYQPQLFSFGPYHHGSEELNPMEEVKFEHLQALLARNPKLELKDYVREIRALEAQARECYADKIGLESEEFVGMMVLDGCFLVEWFLFYD